MRRSVLTDVQTAARYADRSVWTITVLALALPTAAIVVSPNRRRTILQLALGVVAGLVASLLLGRWLEGAILARLPLLGVTILDVHRLPD